MQKIFIREGYKLHLAISGKSALVLLNYESIDLIVSDMPIHLMNGKTFLEVLSGLWPKTKRVLITEFIDINTAICAINAGTIDSYITKPWPADELCSIVARLLI